MKQKKKIIKQTYENMRILENIIDELIDNKFLEDIKKCDFSKKIKELTKPTLLLKLNNGIDYFGASMLYFPAKEDSLLSSIFHPIKTENFTWMKFLSQTYDKIYPTEVAKKLNMSSRQQNKNVVCVISKKGEFYGVVMSIITGIYKIQDRILTRSHQ